MHGHQNFLRITMAGTVIHDITPGIDAAGFTTSPIYQVGDFSNIHNKIIVGGGS